MITSSRVGVKQVIKVCVSSVFHLEMRISKSKC